MDIKQKMEEKRIIINAMDKAIDKTFNENNPQIREEGRKELEKLRGKDNAIPFFIGYAYEIEYYYTQDIRYAQKALNEYKRIYTNGYNFLSNTIEELEAKVNSQLC